MSHDVFISHASEDGAVAEGICSHLEAKGFRCWVAPRDVRPGREWPLEIVTAIRGARAMVLVFSAHANASREVPREVAQATKHSLPIVTLRLDDIAPAGALDYALNTVHWLDAVAGPFDVHLRRLEETLVSILGVSPRSTKGRGAAEVLAVAALLPAFAATTAALQWGKGMGTEIPASAALFGLLVASLALKSWPERCVVAGLSVPILMGAIRMISLPWAGMILGSIFGAIATNLSLAVWDRRLLRAVPITAVAGTVGGVLLSLLYFREFHFGGLFAWQALVGGVLVYQARKHRFIRGPFPRRQRVEVAVIAASSLVWIPASAALARFLVRPGDATDNPVDGLAYRWVPAGDLRLGCSSDDEECRPDEEPTHTVSISKGFWLGETEVTEHAWTKVTNSPPPPPRVPYSRAVPTKQYPDGSLPIANVDWEAASKFCESAGGRLPTEAEWEYAARAGTDTSRFGRRLHDVAWYAGNSGTASAAEGARDARGPHAAGAKFDNDWGLRDMLGNVAEWVSDDYGDAAYKALRWDAKDPEYASGNSNEVRKVVRGGSWASEATDVRVSARAYRPRAYAGPDVGFRCVWKKPN